MTLEEAITDAARKGRVRITVWPASEGYQANLSDDNEAWRVEMGPDPVTALKKVLGILPGASGRLRAEPPEDDVFAPSQRARKISPEEDVFS